MNPFRWLFEKWYYAPPYRCGMCEERWHEGRDCDLNLKIFGGTK